DPFPPVAPVVDVERVLGRVDPHRRADEDVTADRHESSAEDEEVGVEEGAVADVEAASVVEVGRRAEVDALADRAEEVAEESLGGGPIRVVERGDPTAGR